jgi:hypothetical protein
VRRDAEPHRGAMVLVLGIVSTSVSVIALPFLCCVGLGGILSLVGLVLGIPAWVMAQRDLGRMKQGEMDPDGHSQTVGGLVCGIVGTVLGTLGFLAGVAYFGFYMWMLTAAVRTAPPFRPPPAPVPPPPRKVAVHVLTPAPRLADYLPARW